MNNKGQVLVIFVVLLPIILILLAYVFDKCYLLYEQQKISNIADIICDYKIKNSSNELLQQLSLENDSKLTTIEVNKNSITLEKTTSSIFGKLIGIDEYLIKVEKECKQ